MGGDSASHVLFWSFYCKKVWEGKLRKYITIYPPIIDPNPNNEISDNLKPLRLKVIFNCISEKYISQENIDIAETVPNQ